MTVAVSWLVALSWVWSADLHKSGGRLQAGCQAAVLLLDLASTEWQSRMAALARSCCQDAAILCTLPCRVPRAFQCRSLRCRLDLVSTARKLLMSFGVLLSACKSWT